MTFIEYNMKEKKEPGYDWFGVVTKSKKKNKPFSFLGGYPTSQRSRKKTYVNTNKVNYMGTNKNNNNINKANNKIGGKINFLGNPNNNIQNKKYNVNNNINQNNHPNYFKMKPSSLFVKERITQKKKLSKWGDADMDGSPNYFDCDPRNFMKDAKPIRSFIKGVKTAVEVAKDLNRSNTLGEKSLIKVRAKEMYYNDKQQSQKEERAEFQKEITKHRELIDKNKLEIELLNKNPNKTYKDIADIKNKTKKYENDIIILDTEEKKFGKIVAREDKAADTEKTSILAGLTSAASTAKLEKAARMTGPAGTAIMLQKGIEAKLAAHKTPTVKEMMKYQKAKAKTTWAARGTRMAQVAKVGGILGVATGSKLDGGKTYNKELLAQSARVKRMTKEAAGLLFGSSLNVKGGFGSEPRGRGRPAGPSGEYKIGGKPVYEEAFRQWEIKQNELNRMTPSTMQSQELNPEYIAYLKAQEEAKMNQPAKQFEMPQQNPEMRGQDQQNYQQQDQQQYSDGASEDGMNEPVPSDQAPRTEGMTTEEVQAIAEARLRPYTRSSPDEIRQAQHNAQAQDQVLNAPNFMKHELKNAGGSILTSTGPQIMDAPNVFKGEMRNVNKDPSDLGEIHLSERPQVNSTGSEFLDIEIGSGKPVIRKRISERWMTGESM